MRSFPLFAELEAKRDEINSRFHRETKPLLIERFQEFGFVPVKPNNAEYMVLTEKSTGNHYLLTISRYELAGEGYKVLALLEEAKALPWQAVYDEFCLRNNVPVGQDFINEIDSYVAQVISKR